ncbi:hypothetical protein J5N97_007749 [Dioscorea zingiberensis]|uniref:Uncharacterized protein n=1 Tax=Dioscorea zingiberensis TaxID=325984 RepID=A0A9D5DE41_9LILI|nr:hypothetical protein J5N97_007749 [Dioscorea zingiberensis]
MVLCSPCEVLALHLLDEFWFFHNIVNETKTKFDTSSPREGQELQHENQVTTGSLLRTPSLPPRPTAEAVSSIGYVNHNLQHDIKPNPSSKSIRLARSMTRSKPPKFCTKEASLRKAFQEKKWKSLSDLELEEVQGFKDLGFVFDNKQLSVGLMKVIPGLREKAAVANEDETETRRPYLSEAWQLRRLETPTLRWVDRSSVEDKKQQLRSWARAVASNVHQEC